MISFRLVPWRVLGWRYISPTVFIIAGVARVAVVTPKAARDVRDACVPARDQLGARCLVVGDIARAIGDVGVQVGHLEFAFGRVQQRRCTKEHRSNTDWLRHPDQIFELMMMTMIMMMMTVDEQTKTRGLMRTERNEAEGHLWGASGSGYNQHAYRPTGCCAAPTRQKQQQPMGQGSLADRFRSC